MRNPIPDHPIRRVVSRRHRLLVGVALGLAGALTLAACGSSSGNSSGGSSSGATPVKVRTDVFYTGAVLPLLVGVDKGIYSKHGLDVTLNPGKGSATTIQTVGNGSDDIGYADAGTLVQSVAKGIPVEMVAGMVQSPPLAIFAKGDSGIHTAKDLAGKSAGYVPGSAPEMLFPAFAKATGLSPDSVHFDKVDIPTRDSIFLQGKTQFSFGLLNVTKPNLEAKCNCQLTALKYSDAGIDALSSGIITSKDYADKNGDTVKKFLAATAEAVDYTNQHVDDAVGSFFRIDKASTLSTAVVKAQWIASAKLLHSTKTEGQPFGCTANADWQATIDLLVQYGGVDKDKVSTSKIASNSYLSGKCADTLGGK